MSDMLDEAQQKEEQKREAAIARVRQAAHDAAGDGVCCNCRRAIAPERLAANPAAKRCIDCQEEFEEGLR